MKVEELRFQHDMQLFDGRCEGILTAKAGYEMDYSHERRLVRVRSRKRPSVEALFPLEGVSWMIMASEPAPAPKK